MAKFVSTYQKPLPPLSLPDWYAKQWELQQSADVRRSEACRLHNSSKTICSEGNIRTKWDTYMNNVRLVDRITELSRWKNKFEDLLQNLLNEICLMNDEKINIEREIENISRPLQVASECLSMRDCRRGTELTYDEANIELKKELCMLGNLQEELTKRAQSMWEKLNHLEKVKFKLSSDIEDKNETIRIDKENLELDYTCANISNKPKTLTERPKSISYENWLEQCRYIKTLIENELNDCYTLRETMRLTRERAWNDVKAQQDVTNYTLRKRIYQTQKARNEMEWQKLKIQKEMEMLNKEINDADRTLMNKIEAIKCVETRLENRIYRPGTELCKDEVELGLTNEVLQLKQTKEELIKIIENTRTSYNSLESLLKRIVKNLEDKQHSLNTDIMCLDMRSTGDKSHPSSKMNRNITLTRMEEEIPMEP